MKKIICLIVIGLMVASVALTAAEITAKDLAGLKGTWVGSLDFGSEGGIKAHKEIGATFPSTSWSSGCTLEILNDTVPVQAKLTLSDVPGFVASNIGAQAGRKEVNLNDGQLTSQGTIFWISPEGEKNMFEVFTGSEKKLNATYWFRIIRGSAILKKK
jgi:hypothetical protein